MPGRYSPVADRAVVSRPTAGGGGCLLEFGKFTAKALPWSGSVTSFTLKSVGGSASRVIRLVHILVREIEKVEDDRGTAGSHMRQGAARARGRRAPVRVGRGRGNGCGRGNDRDRGCGRSRPRRMIVIVISVSMVLASPWAWSCAWSWPGFYSPKRCVRPGTRQRAARMRGRGRAGRYLRGPRAVGLAGVQRRLRW